MGRHSKNNNSAPTFTYHERKELDYGTKSERIGKDGQKKIRLLWNLSSSSDCANVLWKRALVLQRMHIGISCKTQKRI